MVDLSNEQNVTIWVILWELLQRKKESSFWIQIACYYSKSKILKNDENIEQQQVKQN